MGLRLRRIEKGAVAAEHVRFRPAEDPLGARIPCRDGAIDPHLEDGMSRGGLEQEMQLLAGRAGLRRFLLGRAPQGFVEPLLAGRKAREPADSEAYQSEDQGLDEID